MWGEKLVQKLNQLCPNCGCPGFDIIERSKTLRHPFLKVGSKKRPINLIPDYVLKVNQSYQYLIETIIPSDRRGEVYDFWRTDKVLKDRCEFIASLYQQYIDKQTTESYFIALVADYLLESLYFYCGYAIS